MAILVPTFDFDDILIRYRFVTLCIGVIGLIAISILGGIFDISLPTAIGSLLVLALIGVVFLSLFLIVREE